MWSDRIRMWIGIVLMPIRIRIYMLMPIQIRIRIGIKKLPIHMRILRCIKKQSVFLHDPRLPWTLDNIVESVPDLEVGRAWAPRPADYAPAAAGGPGAQQAAGRGVGQPS